MDMRKTGKYDKAMSIAMKKFEYATLAVLDEGHVDVGDLVS